jgi:hypothetical protein
LELPETREAAEDPQRDGLDVEAVPAADPEVPEFVDKHRREQADAGHGVFPSPSVATSIGSAVNVSIDPA